MNAATSLARVVVCCALLFSFVSAGATPNTWTLNNVVTADGASWTGTFDYDASTNTYSSVNISTTLSGAPNPFNTLSGDYFLGVGCPDPASASGVTVGPNADGVTIFCMEFASALTGAGGTVNLVTGNIGWATLAVNSNIISGYVSATPEPITWTLNDVTTADGASWTGTFAYDALINTYYSINIVTTLGGAQNPFDTLSGDYFLGVGCPDPATASGVTVGANAEGVTIFCMNFASPLTNAGGTVNLVAGDLGWATLGVSSDITGGYVTAQLPIQAQIEVTSFSDTDVVHPHHNGRQGSSGTFPDDLIEVTVLSSSTSVGDPVDLDATDIDKASLQFGPGSGAPTATAVTNNDVDLDGLNDATFEFQTSASALECTDTEATLTGELVTSGEQFEGTDSITPDCDALCHN